MSLEVLARGSRTFSLAARLLPRDRRADAAEVYAFCRTVDDLADDAGDLAALDRIDAALVDGSSPFLEVAHRRDIDVGWARDLVAGCRSDVGRVQIPDDEALVRYAYRVAGTVGLMCCGVLGARMPEASVSAVHLGIAMQLTNICRDVAEDAARGRVYLPAERLRRHGLKPAGVLAGTANPSPVVLELLDLADRYYASARKGFRWLPWRVRPGVAVAAALYRAIGGILRARGGDPWPGRAVVPPIRKATTTVAALVALPFG